MMHLELRVLDESAWTAGQLQALADSGGPAAVQALLRSQGALWGTVAASPAQLLQLFELLDQFLGSAPLLADLAFSGSPQLVLAGAPGNWRLGYWEGELVQHLQPVFNSLGADLAPSVAALGEAAEQLYFRWRQALDQAFVQGGGVALLHD